MIRRRGKRLWEEGLMAKAVSGKEKMAAGKDDLQPVMTYLQEREFTKAYMPQPKRNVQKRWQKPFEKILHHTFAVERDLRIDHYLIG